MAAAKDEHYDVVSVLYHALQGSNTCRTYLDDAEESGDKKLAQFFAEVQNHYEQVAKQAKELLRQKL